MSAQEFDNRIAFAETLIALAKVDPKIIVVCNDSVGSSNLTEFRDIYPERLIDVGIAEQNMIGISAGLADNGFLVFTTSFAPFQTLRCLEQIKVNLAYTKIKVIMVGLASGLVNGPLGHTHCCIEDIGVLRSIPNLTILSPSDGLSVVKTVIQAIEIPGPIYIRLTGGPNCPILYEKDFNFNVRKIQTLANGSDVTILGTGAILHNCVLASKILNNSNITTSVRDVTQIKPINYNQIASFFNESRLVVTVEEHNILGGLGSAVSEVASSIQTNTPQISLGIEDSFLKPGNYDFMLSQCGLSPEQIANKITKKFRNLKSLTDRIS